VAALTRDENNGEGVGQVAWRALLYVRRSRGKMGCQDGPAHRHAVGCHSELPMARECGSWGAAEWLDEAVPGWGPSRSGRFCPGPVVQAGRCGGWPMVWHDCCRRMWRERAGEASSTSKGAHGQTTGTTANGEGLGGAIGTPGPGSLRRAANDRCDAL
jgi:hypothetical protein